MKIKNCIFALFFLFNWPISFYLLPQGKDPSGDLSSKQIIKAITIEQAYKMIMEKKDNADFIIIDVRTNDEYKTGHVKGAINIDIYSKNFNQKINKLDKNKAYLVYCRSGHRSAQAASVMKNQGFREVYNMGSGLLDWQGKGYPVVR